MNSLIGSNRPVSARIVPIAINTISWSPNPRCLSAASTSGRYFLMLPSGASGHIFAT